MNIRSVNTKSRFILILASTLFFSAFACTSKYAFQTSASVPAARGDVKVKKDGNNNYLIKIAVTNLSEVKRLQPAKQAYVVWMVSDNNAMQNLGQINSSSSMLSSTLKASFQTVTSVKPHRIFITAEDDAGTSFPGTTMILTTNDF